MSRAGCTVRAGARTTRQPCHLTHVKIFYLTSFHFLLATEYACTTTGETTSPFFPFRAPITNAFLTTSTALAPWATGSTTPTTAAGRGPEGESRAAVRGLPGDSRDIG